jgi:uncharacterized protein YjbI with pentapeptide repeats
MDEGYPNGSATEKIDVEALISMIAHNGGAKGLNLSGKDLSGIKLSRQALNQIREDRGLKTPPVWQHTAGGINLEGVNLSWAVLVGADLSEGSLRGADLRGSELVGVDFIDADLRDAILWDAHLDFADLDGASFQGAEIFGADFSGSTLCRDNIGASVIQEDSAYTLPPNMGPIADERNRFWQAGKIYRHLKATFDSSGFYSDASWAYRKARRMEKFREWVYGCDAWQRKDRKASIRHFSKFLRDMFFEWLAGYGEDLGRISGWIVVVWLGFAALYGVMSGVVDSNSGHITYRLIDLVSFSLGTMTTTAPVGLEARSLLLMRFLMPFQALLSIALTGLFGFVLGNRMNRS